MSGATSGRYDNLVKMHKIPKVKPKVGGDGARPAKEMTQVVSKARAKARRPRAGSVRGVRKARVLQAVAVLEEAKDVRALSANVSKLTGLGVTPASATLSALTARGLLWAHEVQLLPQGRAYCYHLAEYGRAWLAWWYTVGRHRAGEPDRTEEYKALVEELAGEFSWAFDKHEKKLVD